MANIPKAFVDQISDLIIGLIETSDIPTIKSCKIVSNNGNGKYTVKRNDIEYTVVGSGTYAVNSVVQVILPRGKWKDAIIITPPPT